MLYGTDSQPEEITNTVNATEPHSWPVARAGRQTQRVRDPTHIITLIHIIYEGEIETSGSWATVEPVSSRIYTSVTPPLTSQDLCTPRNTHQVTKSTFTESIIISFIDCHPSPPTVNMGFSASIHCVNHNQRWRKCETWAVVTFLMRSEEDRWRQMHHFGTIFTQSEYNCNLSPSFLSLTANSSLLLCVLLLCFLHNQALLNKLMLETYVTIKEKAAGVEERETEMNHSCRYSEQPPALIALARCPFGVKCYMLAFVFARLLSTRALCLNELALTCLPAI